MEQDLAKGPPCAGTPGGGQAGLVSPTSRASWLECRVSGHRRGSVPALEGPPSFRPSVPIPRGMRVPSWLKEESHMVRWKHTRSWLVSPSSAGDAPSLRGRKAQSEEEGGRGASPGLSSDGSSKSAQTAPPQRRKEGMRAIYY